MCRVNTLLDVQSGVLYVSAEVLDASRRSTILLSVAADAEGVVTTIPFDHGRQPNLLLSDAVAPVRDSHHTVGGSPCEVQLSDCGIRKRKSVRRRRSVKTLTVYMISKSQYCN